jgi:hypothetical protein
MQPTNKAKPLQQSRCMYCGSTNRGKGCRYGPHETHFHPDDPTKCAYCGSPNYGRGCRVNPIGDIHVHGVNYNSMFREQIQSFLDFSVLIHELKKEFTDFEAYKLGVIDKNGNKIKQPETIEEHASYSPMLKNVFRLKRFLGAKVDLLETHSLLEKENTNITDVERYKKYLVYKDKVGAVINELFEVIDKAHEDGLPFEDIALLIKS